MNYFMKCVKLTLLLVCVLTVVPASAAAEASNAESDTGITLSGWGDATPQPTDNLNQSSTLPREQGASAAVLGKQLPNTGEQITHYGIGLGMVLVIVAGGWWLHRTRRRKR